MKARCTYFVWSVGLILISGDSVWSQQSSLYFDRVNFVGACQAIPGNQQSIDFANYPPLGAHDSLTVSNVTFTGRSLGTGNVIDSGIALYNFDSNVPLGIHFANGARAFGANFSSQYNAVSSFTATLSLDNGETFQFTAPTDPNSTFFGFVSSTPIMDLTFSDGGLFPQPLIGHQEMIAKLYMVMQVPEPAAIALAGFGAALLLGWRWQRIRKP